MENFTYHNPTRIVFGKNTIGKLAKLVPADVKVLLLYGGGSIFKNGVHEACRKALEKHTVIEFGGIEANPDYATCMKAVELARREQVGFLLSVGGGSVLDGTKFIAAAIPFKGEPWDILEKNAKISAATPLASVLTLPATGSEANSFSVISRRETRQKLAFGNPLVYPVFSILDPETTYSLDARQTANGVVDAFVHCMEQYMTYPVDAPLQDRQAEAVIQTLIEEGPKVMAHPHDYVVRANIMWACTCALNGSLALGVPQDWATHMIGHELTAFFGIDHARTLAVVLPSLLRQQKAGKQAKLLQFARRIWGITTPDENQAIEEGIQRMEAFFQSLGVPTRLSDHHVKLADALPIAERLGKGPALGERGDITGATIAAILTRAE
ncbi:MAG: iron-containing alcohol dehydrogenase [Verrucomicrobiota bacterium]|nr:iron-containing alcohol dehydrogenase [Verrucomicrobiota bacterium]